MGYFQAIDPLHTMSGKKGKGAPKAQAAKYTSPYANTHETSFGSDFGTGTSSINPQTGLMTTTSSLSPQLKSVADQAGQGLGSSLGYLNQNPQESYANMAAGHDPYYNTLQINNQRILNDQQSQARMLGQQTGMTNSTTMGSELGRISNDDNLRQQNNMATAMQFGNDQARQNASTQMGSISGLANLSYPLASAANSNLTTALGATDAQNQFNAGNQQAMAINNQQQQIAAQQRQSAMIGNLINTGATVAGGMYGGPMGAQLGGMASNYLTNRMGMGQPTTFGNGGSGVPSLMTTFGSKGGLI